MYCGYITNIKNLRPHPNADRLDLGECFGNTVCVGRWEYAEGDVILYFPTDGQLSEEFCAQHDLVRRKDENGNPAGGYLEPGKRNIRAINLRGSKSDGLVMPLSCLEYTGVDMATLTVGTPITVVNGHEICCKYIPRSNVKTRVREGNRTRKHKDPIAPLFKEHADTEQLAYNLAAFKPGDEIEITLKIHGTSQRTANLPVLTGYKRTLWDKITRKPGTPIYEWGCVSGTRRVVLDNYEGGFYGSNAFREEHSKFFDGKLWKGETVYYEVAGFTHTGAPIMSICDNKKLNDKEFIKQYGKDTVFSYGCAPDGFGEPEDYWDDEQTEPSIVPIVPQSRIFVYRMTMTNEDGEVVEYTPDFMRYRCEQMGAECVPVFYRGFIEAIEREDGTTNYRLIGKNALDICDGESAGSVVQTMAEMFYDGTDPIGKTHVREGVVVRIINRPKFTAYKHKNFSFKVLEGIAKADAEAPDMEEAQDVAE
jgi:hypothetical protein